MLEVWPPQPLTVCLFCALHRTQAMLSPISVHATIPRQYRHPGMQLSFCAMLPTASGP